VNTPNAEGATPAYAAALRGNLAMLRLLHSEGADVSKSDNQGVSPLHAAVFEHYIDILNFLMGVEDVIRQLNEPDDSGISVLWVAVQRGDEESISILSSNGASRGDLPPAPQASAGSERKSPRQTTTERTALHHFLKSKARLS